MSRAEVSITTAANFSAHDAVCIIYDKISSITGLSISSISQTVSNYVSLDAAFQDSVQLLPLKLSDCNVSTRVVFSPLSSFLCDVDDVRVFAEAAEKAVVRAQKAGACNPLLILATESLKAEMNDQRYRYALEVSVLGALRAIYVPYQHIDYCRHAGKPDPQPIKRITVFTKDPKYENKALSEETVKYIQAVEAGVILGKDLGDGDPEFMSNLNCAKFIQDSLKDSSVQVEVISNIDRLAKEYPLLHAVARASLKVERHLPCVVRLKYKSKDQSKVKENLHFVGKGISYDTGGADIKAGGVMRGMSRDKCGASNVAGFMKSISLLNPENLNVTADLAFVRNSVGSEAYVSDEVITSRAGVRVLVGNTDAEGRMVMADLLCQAKEEASQTAGNVPTRIFTVATLTGHAVITAGPYSILLSKEPALANVLADSVSSRLYKAGELWADPFVIQQFRREDMRVIRSSGKQDVVQANSKPSTQTVRGHQYPMGFLCIASGIDKDTTNKHKYLYSHMDIAGSAEDDPVGWELGPVTGRPIPALVAAFAGPSF